MPTYYEIRVSNHLSSQWVEWFDGLVIANHPDGQATLTGPLCDQAALFGVLEKVRDLNLGLIAVNNISVAVNNNSDNR
jgi:hypothetical protein